MFSHIYTMRINKHIRLIFKYSRDYRDTIMKIHYTYPALVFSIRSNRIYIDKKIEM